MITKNGAVLMDISIKEFDKINELVAEHKKITSALEENIDCLLHCDFKSQINIGDVDENQPRDGKSYKGYNFEISFKKADEINEIIAENRRLSFMLFQNMDKLRAYSWSVEIESVSCDDFHVIPNDEKKTVAIIPQVKGACLELSNEKAQILAAIIEACVQSW